MGEIRERVRHEAALEASEARVRAMLDSALDSVVTIDHEGRVLEFNASAERTFGYARRDVIGKQMVELLVPPRLQAAHSRGLRHYLATGEGPVLGQRIEVPALRADGSEFPIELSIVRVEMPGPPVFTAYVRDISERVLRDAALRESAAIVGSSFDAIVSRTAEGTVTSWNAAAERIFGYRAEEMIGRSIGILAPPERAGELASVNERLRRFGRLEPFETVRVRKDGLRIDVETTVSPIVDTSGELIAVSAISRDISDRKRSETLSAGQARLLGLVAAGTQLAQLLDLVARFVEEQSSEVLTSIPAARSGRSPPTPRSGTEPSRQLHGGGRRDRDWPRRRLLRHGRLSARAGCRLRHRERPALERLPAARARRWASRLLVDAGPRDGRRSARHLRDVLPGGSSPRPA